MSRLKNSPDSETVIKLEARKSFSFGMRLSDEHGKRIDLTDCNITFVRALVQSDVLTYRELTPEDTLTSVATITSAADGECRFDLQAAELNSPAPADYMYAVVLQTAGGYSVVLLRGVVKLQPNTEFMSLIDTFEGGTPSQVVEVVLEGQNLVQVTVDAFGGDRGPRGIQGITGDDGPSAYEVAVASGYVGTQEDWLASLLGEQGLSAYEVAVAEGFVGTQAAWLATLIGPQGLSAYQVAVAGGFVGTQAAWLATLIGPQGLSAYQVAVAGGFVGSEATWLASLVGPAGPSGATYQVVNNVGDPQFTFARAAEAAPTNCVWLEGQAISRTTYAALFAKYNPVIGTVTTTIAAPGVLTRTAHGLLTGQMVYLTTTGALPTGFSPNVAYYVIWSSANTFRLATSISNAFSGVAITTSGSQSGTHTLRTTFGVGDGSSTFNVPDMRGVVPVGYNASGAFALPPGIKTGEEAHLLTAAESGLPAHSHTARSDVGSAASAGGVGNNSSLRAETAAYTLDNLIVNPNSAANAASAHNNVQPSIIGRWFARYADITLPPAGSTLSVTPVAGTGALRDAAGRTQVNDGVTADDAVNVSQLPNQNLAINGRFRTNTRGAVSGASIALNGYFFDCWQALNSTSLYTWTSAPQGQPVTLGQHPSGARAIRQTVERANIRAGSHVLSWAGGALGRVYNVGGSAPAYAASPVVVTLDGLADVRIELQGAGQTVDEVKLEFGSVATPFVLEPLENERRRCAWFFQMLSAPNAFIMSTPGAYVATTLADIPVQLPYPMRSTPTVVFANVSVYDFVSIIPASAQVVRNMPSASLIVLRVTTTASTISRPAALMSIASPGTATFSADF